MNNTKIICMQVLISGRVQGVGYRQWTLRQAKKLGINGWVRNLSDGRVEAIFEGNQNVVEQMVQFCHDGPANARVTDVISQIKETTSLEGFEIRF